MSSYENGKRTRLGRIWNNMKKRCNNERHESYKYYGAKGIKVCDEWANNVDAFKEWAMANGYNDQLSINRIDNTKDYSPDNCKWSTTKEQGFNRESNHMLSYNGLTMTITEWANRLGINYKTLSARINHGWSTEKALNTPVNYNLSHNKSKWKEDSK